MQVAINPNLYGTAQIYAEQRGLDLAAMIERYLERFIKSEKVATEEAVPDVVLSLLGAGSSVAEDDLNAREAYYQYLEEKYK
ncbi:MAG: hypothetical protein IJR74_02675 [Paludibacteraceae bacterium]|nr:hypothetical protein [Paludibacteraceae bacterium]